MREYPYHHRRRHHPIWLFSIVICLISFPNPSHSFHNINNALSARVSASAATATATATSLSRRLSASSGDNEEDSNNNNNMATDGISVGFIGCGTIASSIAKGLILAAKSNDGNASANNVGNVGVNSIVVSRRSESKSKELIDAYGGKSFDISVSDDNQDILDRCDLIFLTVLPTQASSVLQSLKFDPNRHILVSLVVSVSSLNYYCIVLYCISEFIVFRVG